MSNFNNTNNADTGELIPKSVFVGALPDTNETELGDFFSTYCGKNHIVEIKILRDFRGISKGFGFVTFDNENEVKKILNLTSDIIFKDTKLIVSNAYKRQRFNGPNTSHNTHKSYNRQNYNDSNQLNIQKIQSENNRYHLSPSSVESSGLMTPTPPPLQQQQEQISSSSSSSTSSSSSQSNNEQNDNVKSQDEQSASSSTAIPELANSINQIEKANDSSSLLFSSSSSSSSTSTSITSLTKSTDSKSDVILNAQSLAANQTLDNNNNTSKHITTNFNNLQQNKQNNFKKYDKYPNNVNNRQMNVNNQRTGYFNQQQQQQQRNYPTRYYNNNNQNQNQLSVQTSNQQLNGQHVNIASPYYYAMVQAAAAAAVAAANNNSSTVVSPVKSSSSSTKANQFSKQQVNSKNLKNQEVLKINTANNFVGSVLTNVYPNGQKSNGPLSSGSKSGSIQTQQQQSQTQNQSYIASAAAAIANYANQTSSVNSSSALNSNQGQNTSQNQNYSANLFTGEYFNSTNTSKQTPSQPTSQPTSIQQQPQQQNQPSYIYPNYYYYANPNSIYIDPNVSRANPITSPLTPHSYQASYYQTPNPVIIQPPQQPVPITTNLDSQPTSNSNSNSQSTISNAFETVTNNATQSQNISSSLSVEQLDDMMKKGLNIQNQPQYDPNQMLQMDPKYVQQYTTQPIYYLATQPGQYYATYYYQPAIQSQQSNQQAQLQLIPTQGILNGIHTPNPGPLSNNSQSQSGISYMTPNPQSYVQQQQQQQQQIANQSYQPQVYALQQQQMTSTTALAAQPGSNVPILQLPTISYYSTTQSNIMPQITIPQNSQYQYQSIAQPSPQSLANNTTGTQYQYASQYTSAAITPNNNLISSTMSQNQSNTSRNTSQQGSKNNSNYQNMNKQNRYMNNNNKSYQKSSHSFSNNKANYNQNPQNDSQTSSVTPPMVNTNGNTMNDTN